MSRPKIRMSLGLILAMFFFFIGAVTLLEHLFNPVTFAAGLNQTRTLDTADLGTIPLQTITLTKQASKAYVKPGEQITYTLRVDSIFTKPVSVHLTDTLPAALHNVSTPTATYGTVSKAENLITWTATITQQVVAIRYSAVVTRVNEDDLIPNPVKLELGDHSLRAVTATVQVKTHWNVFLPSVQKMPPLPVMVNGDFDAGSHTLGWNEASAKFNNTLIVAGASLPSPVTPHSLNYVAWLGGQDSETADLTQKVFIPAGYPDLKLRYFYWVASLDTQCGGNSDVGYLRVNNTVRRTFNLCKANNTNGWQEEFISVAEYANQTVTFAFTVALDGAQNSNLFLDDVAFCTHCGQ